MYWSYRKSDVVAPYSPMFTEPFAVMSKINCVPLDDDEVAQFETLRDGFLDNPVARQFLDAQESMRRFQMVVGEHVAKTFELGRIPTADDFPEDCGEGCGCDSEEA